VHPARSSTDELREEISAIAKIWHVADLGGLGCRRSVFTGCGRFGMRRAARDEVARVIADEPGRLRRAGATTVLALLAASALAPVAVEVAAGGGMAGALAGVAGNIGSGYITDIIERVAARIGRGRPDRTQARELLAAEFLTALEQRDSAATGLGESLAGLLSQVGGVETAAEDLRVHLLACFEELSERHRGIAAEQRRHGRQMDEVLDRLRFLMRDRPDAVAPATIATTTAPVLVPGSMPQDRTWRGGAELTVGDRVYLLNDVLLDERPNREGSVLLRQARALRLVPSGGPDRYVWLRQVEAHPGVPEARQALRALERERHLLAQVGEPRVSQFEADGPTVTLAVGWPLSKAANAPCDPLVPGNAYRAYRLLGGLAGLCGVLARLHAQNAAHRSLAPERIIAHDDGRLSLLDLGLAGHDPMPGEGPAYYQAPEQRRRGTYRPGPRTDVYQLAAVAYHLMAGHPPHASSPLPLRSQASDVPERAGSAIDTALSADPAERPDVRTFGAALRADL
jgi:hypothetical protein